MKNNRHRSSTHQAHQPDAAAGVAGALMPGAGAEVGMDALVTELDEARELQVQERLHAAAKITRLIHYRRRCQHEAAARWGQRHTLTAEKRLVARQEADRAAVREISAVLRQSEQTTLGVLNAAQFCCDHMPEVWGAFRSGDLDLARLRKIATIGSGVQKPANLALLDEAAAACAGDRTVGELRSWLNRYLAALDQEEFTQQCAQAREARCMRLFHRGAGLRATWALVPTIAAAAIEKQLHRAVRAAKAAAGGEAPENAAGGGGGGGSSGRGEGGDGEQARDGAVRNDDLRDGVAWDGTVRDGAVQCTALPSDDVALSSAGEHTPAELAALLAQAVGFGEPAVRFTDASCTAARSTEDGTHTTDQRTVLQREADLFVSWLSGGDGGQGTTGAKIAVMIPVSTLTGDSEEPGVSADRQWALPAGQARERACLAGARHDWYSLYYRDPPVADDPSGTSAGNHSQEHDPLVPQDLLSIRYEGHDPPPKLRDALLFRDGTCQAPGCTVPADRCDLDHQQPWPHGPTTAENLIHLCRRHHRQKSHGHLTPAAQTAFPPRS